MSPEFEQVKSRKEQREERAEKVDAVEEELSLQPGDTILKTDGPGTYDNSPESVKSRSDALQKWLDPSASSPEISRGQPPVSLTKAEEELDKKYPERR